FFRTSALAGNLSWARIFFSSTAEGGILWYSMMFGSTPLSRNNAKVLREVLQRGLWYIVTGIYSSSMSRILMMSRDVVPTNPTSAVVDAAPTRSKNINENDPWRIDLRSS